MRTEVVTTLAVASARKYTKLPIVVVNCDPTPFGRAYAHVLEECFDIDTFELPLDVHGETLDRLFQSTRDTSLFLLDSDAELLTPRVADEIEEALDSSPAVFGAGFVHGPEWVSAGVLDFDGTTLYQQRPWMPCCALRVSYVREAISAGVSFRPRLITERAELYNMKFGIGAETEVRMDAMYCDTGADIMAWNQFVKRRVYAGKPVRISDSMVSHLHGVTRMSLSDRATVGTKLEDVTQSVKNRLLENYGVSFDDLSAKAELLTGR